MDETQWMVFINQYWGTLVYWQLIQLYRQHKPKGPFFGLTALACRDKLLLGLAHCVDLSREIARYYDVGPEAKKTVEEIVRLYQKGESSNRSEVQFEDCGIKVFRDKILAHPLDHIKEALGKPEYAISLQWQTVEDTLSKLRQFADQVEAHHSRHWNMLTVKEDVGGIDIAFTAVMVALEYAEKFRDLQRILIDKGGRASVHGDVANDQIVVET